MNHASRQVFSLLSASLPVTGLGEAQLLPYGAFSARDGRPGPGKQWRVDDQGGRQLAAQMNAVASLTPIVIDYDHQTLRAAQNGKPAPAAGWIRSVEWRSLAGLFAKVDWTADAKACIDARTYRYISPVITFDNVTGAVTGVLLAALVNHPALLGMSGVVSQLASQFTPNTPLHSATQMSDRSREVFMSAFGRTPEELRAIGASRDAAALSAQLGHRDGFDVPGYETFTDNQKAIWMNSFGKSPAELRRLAPSE